MRVSEQREKRVSPCLLTLTNADTFQTDVDGFDQHGGGFVSQNTCSDKKYGEEQKKDSRFCLSYLFSLLFSCFVILLYSPEHFFDDLRPCILIFCTEIRVADLFSVGIYKKCSRNGLHIFKKSGTKIGRWDNVHILCSGRIDDILNCFVVGFGNVADDADDLKSLVFVFFGKRLKRRHFIETVSTERGPHIDHCNVCLCEECLIHSLAALCYGCKIARSEEDAVSEEVSAEAVVFLVEESFSSGALEHPVMERERKRRMQ